MGGARGWKAEIERKKGPKNDGERNKQRLNPIEVLVKISKQKLEGGRKEIKTAGKIGGHRGE